MAKRMNPFADDFKELSQTAEKTVLAFKSQGDEKEETSSRTSNKPTPKKQVQSDSAKASTSNQKPTTEGQINKTAKKTKKAKEWGKPTALFNTRIPPEMSELLDDLVYQQRKQGTPKTKQDLAREALADLLRKHAMI